MNKPELKQAFDDAKFSFYKSIATLIVDNPTISLSALREQHGITQYQMWTAQNMFHVHRQTGKGSLAYRTSIK